MRKLKRILLFCFFFFVLNEICIETKAQFGATEPFSGTSQTAETLDDPPTDPCNDPQNPDEPPVYCPVPIDSGLAFLLIVGIGYGILINRSSQKKESFGV